MTIQKARELRKSFFLRGLRDSLAIDAQKNPSMAPVPLSPPIYVDVSLLRKKDSYVSEGIRKLERYMEESNPFEK